MASRNELRDQYRRVMDRVAAAAERSGRRAEDVITVAVTKTASPDQIRQLIELGHMDLGENRVQQLTQRAAMTEEFVSRHRALTSARSADVPERVRWHMIGHLQRNKVKPVLPLVTLIHSVDSLRLAEEIQSQAERQEREIDVLIQVNPSGEKNKYGVSLPAAPHLAEQMQTMFNVRVRGLMAMAPYYDDPEQARPLFERTAEVFVDMKADPKCGERFNILSMGMSDDFEVAVECGANVVRLGRAIFGEGDDAGAADDEAG
jgi:pyridoxal phosphate enzyme (YggS family)